MRRLNQASFAFAVFCVVCFSGLCLVCLLFIFLMSSVLYFSACINVSGTV